MPVLFVMLGIAAVVFIAAAGRHGREAHVAPQLPAPASAGALVELDRGMPPSVVQQVLTALGGETDPARLEALAITLARHYPLSAGELRVRATALRGSEGASTPRALPSGVSGAPAPDAAPAPTTPQPQPGARSSPAADTPAPQQRELDAAVVLQAAMRALVEETDPVVLEGFAASIRASYPAAADILTSRAQALRASSSGAAANASPALSPAGVPS